MKPQRALATYFAAALALFAGAALSQPTAVASCDEQRAALMERPPREAVTRLAGNACLGGERDTNEFALSASRQLRTADRIEGKPKAIKDVTFSVEERRALGVAVLRAADGSLGAIAPVADANDRLEIERLRFDLQQAIQERLDGAVPGAQSRVLRPDHWRWEPGDRDVPPALGATGIDVLAMFRRANCDADRRGATCAATQRIVEGLLRAAMLAGRSFAADQAVELRAAESRAAERDARWRSYFADARSQYPWELYVNSLVYESTLRSNLGISGPPNWQWIVLHPDAGMQYVRSAAAGDRFKPALVLELIGYNRWSWGGDHKPQNAWGASLVRTYADTVSVPSGAWGVAVHYNNKYTLTLSRHDGKTGILLSADLLGALTSASQAWKDRFRIGD